MARPFHARQPPTKKACHNATVYCLAIENILTNHQSERTVRQEGGHQAVEKIKKQDENSRCHCSLISNIIPSLYFWTNF